MTDSSSTLSARFQVPFEYRVHFTRSLFDPENPTLLEALGHSSAPARTLFILDSGLVAAWPRLADDIRRYAAAHRTRMDLVGPPLVIPGGEISKNQPELQERLHREIALRGIDRHAFCVIVGGGAVLDAAGFAAGVAHRGLRVVRVPTTVLAQNDSGIGVKNGINAQGSKNFLGTFAPPWAVILDSEFLKTLSDRDFRAGIAESIKVALLKDADFFDRLCGDAPALARRDPEAAAHMIRRGAELHLEQITRGGDPFESGSARPLDFGHWAAHRLERLTGHQLRHGEAVAIGMALDTLYAEQIDLASDKLVARLLDLLQTLGFQLFHPSLLPAPDGHWPLWEGLSEFQQHLGGRLTITLVASPGSPVDVHTMDPSQMLRAVRRLEERFGHQPALMTDDASPKTDAPPSSRLWSSAPPTLQSGRRPAE